MLVVRLCRECELPLEQLQEHWHDLLVSLKEVRDDILGELTHSQASCLSYLAVWVHHGIGDDVSPLVDIILDTINKCPLFANVPQNFDACLPCEWFRLLHALDDALFEDRVNNFVWDLLCEPREHAQSHLVRRVVFICDPLCVLTRHLEATVHNLADHAYIFLGQFFGKCFANLL